MEKRLDRLGYDRLIAEDLELGAGAVEGAVKNIIGKRCDHGGMRWIRERVEAVVQLRRIEANGDFEHFTDFAHRRIQAQARSDAIICRLHSREPAALPTPVPRRDSGGSAPHSEVERASRGEGANPRVRRARGGAKRWSCISACRRTASAGPSRGEHAAAAPLGEPAAASAAGRVVPA